MSESLCSQSTTEESNTTCRENEEEEKGQGKEQSKQKHKTEAFHTFFLAIVPSIKEMWKDNSRRKNSGRI